MSNNTNWELVAKYLSGECSLEEIHQIEEWINADVENQKLFNSIKTIWNTPEEKFESSDIKTLWENVAKRTGLITETVKSPIYTLPEKENIFSKILQLREIPLIRYAAVFLIIVSTSLLYFILSNKSGLEKTIAWNSFNVKNGIKETITLTDGSKIIADAGSFIQYPDNYGEDSREVKLNGEAYFEVVHNPQIPFKVYSGNSIVQVLGTKFNVRAWDEGEQIVVAVIEGKVSFGSLLDKNETVTLEKGFSSSLYKNGKMSALHLIDEKKALSWVDGEIYFENTSLSVVLSQLERWFDITIVLSDKSIGSERLSVFIQNKTLTENLEIISQLIGTHYDINNNTVTFKSNN